MPDEEAETDPDWLPAAPAGREDLVRKLSKHNQQIRKIWRTWTDHYLNFLREKQCIKPRNPRSTTNRLPELGEVVLIYDDQKPRQFWSLARVTELVPSADQVIRSAIVVTSNGRPKKRSIGHLYPLEINDLEVAPGSVATGE
uniref:DUF5641 domain-containing protein n=2 Tax=Panagrellus redivivus TaxID=6233 RepID=A0A7E4VTJ4_PANRE